MKILLDKRLIGRSQHIIVDCEKFFSINESDVIPDGMLHLSGKLKKSSNCLDTIILLEHLQFPIKISSAYENVARTVLKEKFDTTDIPWQDFMPKEVYDSFLESVVSSVISLSKSVNETYFRGVWTSTNVSFSKLRQAKIDKSLVEEILSKEVFESQISCVKSFDFDDNQMSSVPQYNRFSTRTGRTTIKSGPQILTIKKEYRKIIKSIYDDGTIISMDFKGLEARIMFHETHEFLEHDDIYEFINQTYFKGLLNRSIIKEAVLCELFGMSAENLAEKIGASVEKVKKFILKIKLLFNTESVIDRLRKEFVTTGYIRSKFGRKILVPETRLLLNSYIQSTGVEVSLLGFKNLIEILEKISLDIRPLMIIHDDLMIDCPGYLIEKIVDIKHVPIPRYQQSFPIDSNVVRFNNE